MKRLKTIEGHLRRVTRMVEDDAYCIDVLHQTTAVKNAIAGVETLLLDSHLHGCVMRDIKAGKKQSIDELLLLFKKINK